MRRYATYFDRHYLTRGLALVQSIRRHDPGAEIVVLCLDAETERVLGRLADGSTTVLPLAWLEAADPELAAVKPSRTLVEYYFTLTAPFLRQLLARCRPEDRLLYLDADHYLFAPLDPLFADLETSSVIAADHRYPDFLADKYVYGVYNVGVLGFRPSDEARRCLDRWRAQCIEWCHDRLEGDRYADQKYLDEWPRLYAGFREITDPGTGLALWNAPERSYHVRGGRLYVDGAPLRAYHFSDFRVVSGWLFDCGDRKYGYRLDRRLKQLGYVGYARALQRSARRVRVAGGQIPVADSIRAHPTSFRLLRGVPHADRLYVLAAAAAKQSLLVVAGPVALA